MIRLFFQCILRIHDRRETGAVALSQLKAVDGPPTGFSGATHEFSVGDPQQQVPLLLIFTRS